MHERGKSDSPVVPAKPPNNAAVSAAEVVEERGLAKGNTASKTRPGHRAGQGAPSALDRVRQVASTPEPEAGAQCVRSARWDLCGGPPARAVPTANLEHSHKSTIAKKPPDSRDGVFPVTDEPGLEVEIDQNAVERYTV